MRRELQEIAEHLGMAFGRPRRRLSDPLDSLVQTVLSQNTSDVNSGRAFAALKMAFPDWQRLASSRPATIERVIRVGGLARIKSRRLVTLLRAIVEREDGLDLRRWRRLSATAVAERLDGLPGVGPKTRACVLLFAIGQPAFPVDTHVHRIALRLGLVPPGTSATRCQAQLEPHVPQARALDLHLNLIRLGREVCRPRLPRCGECPLSFRCDHASARAA